MLSSQEQRVWEDIQLFWAEEAEEPPRLAPLVWAARDQEDLPVAVVAGAAVTILLLLFGAALAALTVAVVTALGWALWHNRLQRSGRSAEVTSPESGEERTTRGPANGRTGRDPT